MAKVEETKKSQPKTYNAVKVEAMQSGTLYTTSGIGDQFLFQVSNLSLKLKV